MELKSLIREYRKSMNMTQVELANKLNINHEAVSFWELGKRKPDYDSLRGLCIIFNISADELLQLDCHDYNQSYDNLSEEQLQLFNKIKNMDTLKLALVMGYIRGLEQQVETNNVLKNIFETKSEDVK